MAFPAVLKRRSFGETQRQDAWWLQPGAVVVGLGLASAYATWAALQADHYVHGGYLSPLYSPEVFGLSHHAWFEGFPNWWPSFVPQSPALFILILPLGFRATCYYYRGAYYKAFWADPPACAVGEPRNAYRGENSFPLIVQNIHRYFLFAMMAWIFVFFPIDVYRAFEFETASGGHGFGIGVGSFVLLINWLLLSGYALGCHSTRHVIGGFRNVMAGRPFQSACYRCVSCLNRRHMAWAWLSLIWVTFSDIYVRLCSMGVWTDFRLV